MEYQSQKPIVVSDNLYGWYFLITIIFPILSFSIHTTMDSISSTWQSGQTNTFANLFLLTNASWIFFPLIGYSVISLLSLSNNNPKIPENFFVRLGVYTGVILSIQYSILLILAFSGYLIIVWIVPSLLFYIFKEISQSLGKKLKRIIKIITLIVTLILAIIYLMKSGFDGLLTLPYAIFAIGILVILFSSPFWALLVFIKTSITLLKYYETIPYFTIRKIIGVLSWLTLYGFALRINILKMYEIYASLPTQPPDCYIATATAKGHPQFVGSQKVRLKNGEMMQVTQQLQRFKFAEIAFMAIFPSLHKTVRKLYNVFGKKLAHYIQNPLLADIAFLLLIPLEWITFFILKLIIPESKDLTKKIYTS